MKKNKRNKKIYHDLLVITVTTDASWCPNTRSAGYAYVLKSNNFTIKKSGQFKSNPYSSNEAEVMCIGNAINHLLTMEIPPVRHLVINTDSLHAANRVYKPSTNTEKKVHQLYFNLVKKIKCFKHSVRHVKAHNNTPDARSHVNEWCDKEAKKQMNLKRNSLSNETIHQIDAPIGHQPA